METVASFPCRVFFYPVGLGLFVKTDDNKSRSGGPCSADAACWGMHEPRGLSAALASPQDGSEKRGCVRSFSRKGLLVRAVGCRKRQTPPV